MRTLRQENSATRAGLDALHKEGAVGGGANMRKPAKLIARVPAQRRPDGHATLRRFTGKHPGRAGKATATVVANQPAAAVKSFHVADWPDERKKQRETAGRKRGAAGGANRHHAAAAWVRELAETKERLGQELAANLKQLRDVLDEGQRIAADLAIVLKETSGQTAAAESVSEPRQRSGAVAARRPSKPREH